MFEEAGDVEVVERQAVAGRILGEQVFTRFCRKEAKAASSDVPFRYDGGRFHTRHSVPGWRAHSARAQTMAVNTPGASARGLTVFRSGFGVPLWNILHDGLHCQAGRYARVPVGASQVGQDLRAEGRSSGPEHTTRPQHPLHPTARHVPGFQPQNTRGPERTFARRLLNSCGCSLTTSPSCWAAALRVTGVVPVSSRINSRSSLTRGSRTNAFRAN